MPNNGKGKIPKNNWHIVVDKITGYGVLDFYHTKSIIVELTYAKLER